ncbi:MAG TPA: biotin carboxylase N-terminal domain-containing protein [Wenzhouxiangella sp.]|nr:biotin carboxylase N-terminal domain-containing protein [Wenzhouxiangella sp.]
MFERILIANRGEIACRIIDTCRRLGVETVAVYSDADASARHVRRADHAIHIGASEANQSYLNIERIVQAAMESDAQAIHPGYGFLAENADFARAVGKAGLVLIGPSAKTMDIMGSKAAAKKHMETAGVPLIPGYHGDDQGDEILLEKAAETGFPLMLKAAAGGGGKGMRVVNSKNDFPEALAAARRESLGAFGDDRMILERYLPRPRHIEAQIFGDSYGNVVHLFERDCSSQRRHQKVIEEAPAAGLDASVRDSLLEAAVRAARAVDYRGAGTVEFLVDGDEFFFLEMNTRLQVEHPVTELITGLDLVEWQLRVAAGQKLPLQQEDIRMSGHAMEARIYAEDPDRSFMPSTGKVSVLNLPGRENVRIDSGIEAGDEVSVHYDPMVAKLIVHGDTRQGCLQQLKRALAASFIAGPTTNLGFLQALAGSEVFARGEIDTGLLDRDLESIVGTDAAPPVEATLAAAGYRLLDQEQVAAGHSPWDAVDGWRLGRPATRSIELACGDWQSRLEATGTDGQYEITVAPDDSSPAGENSPGASHEINLGPVDGPLYSLQSGAQRHNLYIHAARGENRIEVCMNNRRWSFSRLTRFHAAGPGADADGRLLAPMPGKILQLSVQAGQSVREGEVLLIMEAMKMELAIKSPIDGRVSEIGVSQDETIEADTLLLMVEPEKTE